MPADRLIHPRLGESQKVSGLTDFEYRVWTWYLLCADDFGVMPRTAAKLQADNRYLRAKPARLVQRALDLLVSVGLLLPFEHQGAPYVCQWDWQAWQGVKYPRRTFQPKPPADVVTTCCLKTQKLFARWPGGNLDNDGPRDAPIDGQRSGERLENKVEASRARETANANANANGSERVQGESALSDPADAYEHWRERVLAALGATVPLTSRASETQAAIDLCARYPLRSRLDALIDAYLTSQHKQLRAAPPTLGQVAKWASWLESQDAQPSSVAAAIEALTAERQSQRGIA